MNDDCENVDRFISHDEFVDASVKVLRGSDRPQDVIIAELFLLCRHLNLNKLEREMNQLGNDVVALAGQVQTNTATEAQLIAALDTAIANADDASTDTTVQSTIAQLKSNNDAMQAELAKIAPASASGGTTAPAGGTDTSGGAASGGTDTSGAVSGGASSAPVTGADLPS
jgi:cell division septation protein DedD